MEKNVIFIGWLLGFIEERKLLPGLEGSGHKELPFKGGRFD